MSALYQVDFARLQSDTALLALSTSDSGWNLHEHGCELSNPVVTYCTLAPGIIGCLAGSVVTLGGGPATPIIAGAPFRSLSQVVEQRFSCERKYRKVINSECKDAGYYECKSWGSDVLTAMILPPASSSLSSGSLDFIEDVTESFHWLCDVSERHGTTATKGS